MAQLADEIWHEHYQNILSPEQIDYMVERYQSVQAITEQLEQGYHYLLALEDGQPCGFCGYHRETDRMFLSKIYIRKDFRRRGIASAFLKQVTEESQGLAAIYLTVNKHNAGSITAYQHFGFETIDSVGDRHRSRLRDGRLYHAEKFITTKPVFPKREDGLFLRDILQGGCID